MQKQLYKLEYFIIMKSLKYFILLLASFSFIMISCSSNDDSDKPEPPGPPPPEDTVDIDESEYIFGEWEVGYFTKTVDSTSPFRNIIMDGFTITFDKNYSYKEKNSLGEVNLEGSFKVKDKNNIILTFKASNGVDDTTMVFKVTTLTDKVMVRVNEYETKYENEGSTTIFKEKDIQYLRNTATAPEENFEGYPGVRERDRFKKLVPDYFNGAQWELTLIRDRISTNGVDYSSWEELKDSEKYKGNKFSFVIDKNSRHGTFTEILDGGTGVANKGEVVLIDDVMHLYYYTDEKGKTVGKMAALHINTLSSNQFEDYTRQTLFTGNNKFQLRDIQSIFYRP